MIAFGCASSDERRFRAHAARTIEAVSESSSLLMRHHHVAEFDRPCNEMIAAAAECEDLEALVLVHQDLEIEDDDFLPRLRRLLAAAPEVAIVGRAHAPGAREVEAIDGDLIVLSAWACSELRFDPRFAASLDASAADLCFLARADDRRVLADPFDAVRPPSPGDPARRRREVEAGVALRRKWAI